MFVCFFYSFATIAGSALVPGGIGVADGALSFGALQYIPNVVEAQALLQLRIWFVLQQCGLV